MGGCFFRVIESNQSIDKKQNEQKVIAESLLFALIIVYVCNQTNVKRKKSIFHDFMFQTSNGTTAVSVNIE